MSLYLSGYGTCTTVWTRTDFPASYRFSENLLFDLYTDTRESVFYILIWKRHRAE